jgi:hypothetical protein
MHFYLYDINNIIYKIDTIYIYIYISAPARLNMSTAAVLAVGDARPRPTDSARSRARYRWVVDRAHPHMRTIGGQRMVVSYDDYSPDLYFCSHSLSLFLLSPSCQHRSKSAQNTKSLAGRPSQVKDWCVTIFPADYYPSEEAAIKGLMWWRFMSRNTGEIFRIRKLICFNGTARPR